MEYLKKNWYWFLLGVLVLAAIYFYSSAKNLTAPAGVPDPELWLATYRQKLANAEPFSPGEMENREQYKWNVAQHRHNKAVWQTNQELGTNVNANKWNWPA